MDIYTKTILRFASNIPNAERLKSPDVSITKRTAVCGSSMTVDLNIKNGKIEQIGLDIKACALGQASASIFAKNAIGLTLKEVQKLKNELISFLKTGDFLIKTPFEDYKYLEPARSVPYRHDSILLVLDSTEEGLNKWIN
jgi:NifU-like protein involved in Fe-S cluster formation